MTDAAVIDILNPTWSCLVITTGIGKMESLLDEGPAVGWLGCFRRLREMETADGFRATESGQAFSEAIRALAEQGINLLYIATPAQTTIAERMRLHRAARECGMRQILLLPRSAGLLEDPGDERTLVIHRGGACHIQPESSGDVCWLSTLQIEAEWEEKFVEMLPWASLADVPHGLSFENGNLSGDGQPTVSRELVSNAWETPPTISAERIRVEATAVSELWAESLGCEITTPKQSIEEGIADLAGLTDNTALVTSSLFTHALSLDDATPEIVLLPGTPLPYTTLAAIVPTTKGARQTLTVWSKDAGEWIKCAVFRFEIRTRNPLEVEYFVDESECPTVILTDIYDGDNIELISVGT